MTTTEKVGRTSYGADDPAELEWTRCPGCQAFVYLRRLRRRDRICPECAHHFRLCVTDRLDLLLDSGSFRRRDADLAPADVLSFADTKPYPARLEAAQRRTGNPEGAVWGTGAVDGNAVVIVVLDFDFLGGSLGSTTGELISRAARHALVSSTPLVMVSASGGARMQEGPLSLMQLAKTAQEIGKLREHGVLTVNVNTDPTYGGTTASYAMLGDIIVAEPGARIGFAGPEVIKNTIKRTPPEGFQNAESLYQNGLIDLVVPRAELRDTLAGVLAVHATTDAPVAPAGSAGYQTDPAALSARDPVAVVAGARDIGRPNTLDYCSGVFDAFLELHGDRLGTDDLSVVGGIGSLAGRPMMVLGHQKGHDSAELVRRNFGMARPAGYRKALRLMDYAERHGMPLVTFVDTPGAYPDVEAERYGQGTAIAECVLAMSRLRVPTIVVVTGEGGSGGALALGVGNRFLMCSGAYFSVISPEGAATILFGGTEHAPRMATALHITASDLLRLGIADGVLLEPEGGAAKDPSGMFAVVRAALRTSVAELVTCSPEQIVLDRYHKMCRFGDPDNQADLIERMATR